MRRVWIVDCENKYQEGGSAELICGTEGMANEMRDLMQAAADAGDKGESPLQEAFYGRYTVEERILAETPEEVAEAWSLGDVIESDFFDRCPDGWKERLTVLIPHRRVQWEHVLFDLLAHQSQAHLLGTQSESAGHS